MGAGPTAFALAFVLPGASGCDWIEQGAECCTIVTPMLSDVLLY